MSSIMRSLPIFAVFWLSICLNQAQAINREQIETELGVYEISVISIASPFELTDSMESGVLLQEEVVPSLNRTPVPTDEKRLRLIGFRASDPKEPLGRLEIESNTDWCVIENELYVARTIFKDKQEVAQLDRYQIPDLTRSFRIMRVPNGWFCNGIIYDNTGTRVQCMIQSQSVATGRRDFQSIKSEIRDLRNTNALVKWPLKVDSDGNNLLLTGLAPHQARVEIIRSKSLGWLGGLKIDHVRVDEDVCYVTLGPTGVVLRILRFDADKMGLPLSQRLAYQQPTFLLNEVTKNLSHQFLDGPNRQLNILFPDGSNGKPFSNELLLDDVAGRQFATALNGNSGKDLAETRAMLADVAGPWIEEFEKTVGRKPDGTPVAVRVHAGSAWPTNWVYPSGLSYIVWAEINPDAVLLKMFKQIYDAEKLKRESEEEIRNAVARQQFYLASLRRAGITSAIVGLFLLFGGLGIAAYIFQQNGLEAEKQKKQMAGASKGKSSNKKRRILPANEEEGF